MPTQSQPCRHRQKWQVVTGSGPNTIRFHQIARIRWDRKKGSEELCAEDPGGTTLKSHDVRRDPAFRRNSNTLIMASASFAVVLGEHHPANIRGAHWYDDAYELLGSSRSRGAQAAVNYHNSSDSLILRSGYDRILGTSSLCLSVFRAFDPLFHAEIPRDIAQKLVKPVGPASPTPPTAAPPVSRLKEVQPRASEEFDRAVQMLALLQRDGRLVDFLAENISAYPDVQLGAAVRTIHDTCRQVLDQYVKIEPIMN